ncbi:hypothetical protein COC69_33035 [Bacillus cereus]|uniref:Lipoprotein n=1 Tax=Bacillus cereus TaxID=1396 RepID=A0A9X7GSI1_BACCE|nr:hypothetical protein [Bacillus cereus]PGS61013.1 hypothetical protein COC69_33035 [Bacillus cereus]
MKLLRLFLILTLVVLLSACGNTAVKVTKVQKNGELKGYYDVQTIKTEQGNVQFPFDATVEEGTILLQITKDDKVIYEEEVTSQKEGLLSFEAPKSGSYNLIVRVKNEKEKAKGIQIHTKL